MREAYNAVENISCENIIGGKIHGSVSGILIKRIYTISTIGSPNFFSSYFNGDVQIPLPPTLQNIDETAQNLTFSQKNINCGILCILLYMLSLLYIMKKVQKIGRVVIYDFNTECLTLYWNSRLKGKKFRQMTKNRLIRRWIYALLVQYISRPRCHKSTSKWDTRNSTIFWNKTSYQSSGILAVCRLSKQQQIEQLLNSIVQKYYMKQSFTEELFLRLCSYFYWSIFL